MDQALLVGIASPVVSIIGGVLAGLITVRSQRPKLKADTRNADSQSELADVQSDERRDAAMRSLRNDVLDLMAQISAQDKLVQELTLRAQREREAAQVREEALNRKIAELQQAAAASRTKAETAQQHVEVLTADLDSVTARMRVCEDRWARVGVAATALPAGDLAVVLPAPAPAPATPASA